MYAMKTKKKGTIDASFDPDISMLIAGGPVPGEEQTRVGL
jgi:hypothetical protein